VTVLNRSPKRKKRPGALSDAPISLVRSPVQEGVRSSGGGHSGQTQKADMLIIDYAKQRVSSVIKEIDRLRQSEFPYRASRDCLNELKEIFNRRLFALETAPPGSASARNECTVSLFNLFVYLPILGFILRSTNARNTFEAYGPLLQLGQRILGKGNNLILSSEWDYSPYVYKSIADLPAFTLIGLPASESSNPLLVPLAGHELGHSIWASERTLLKFDEIVKNSVLQEIDKRWSEYSEVYPYQEKGDMWTGKTAEIPHLWAMLQMEEIFCDFVGLRLFAESFLHALTYLMSPRLPGERSLHYPNIVNRVRYLIDASNKFSISVPPDFEFGFMAEDEPTEPEKKLLISIADTVSSSFVSDLIDDVGEFLREKDVPMRNSDNVLQISKEFYDWVSPTSKSYALVDILNAGWNCMLDKDLWKNVAQVKPEDRERVLKDIVLKSIEVSEVYELIKEQS